MKAILILTIITFGSYIGHEYSYNRSIHTQLSSTFKSKTEVPRPSINVLIDAIIQVESSGNDSAHNLSEDAVGCLQIRPIMVKEVNRILRKSGSSDRFTLSDRGNRQESIKMFLVFNKDRTKFEEIARCWNGGARGMSKSSTVKYWNKVKTKLK